MRSLLLIGLAVMLLLRFGASSADETGHCPASLEGGIAASEATYVGRLRCGYPEISEDEAAIAARAVVAAGQPTPRGHSIVSWVVSGAIIAGVYFRATRPKPG